MVKVFSAVFLLFLLAAPVLAQDDYPRVEMGFGYANISVPGATLDSTLHRSGFGMHTNFNFTRMLGLDNYTGYYSLGSGSELFTNIFSGKVMLRRDKVTPYLLAGIGGAQLSVQQDGYYYSGGSSLARRVGGGFDYKLTDGIGWRVDVSKLQFHSRDSFGSKIWVGGFNLSTGIVITLMQ